MKTFKLKSLKIIQNIDEEIGQKNIPLIDGLTINREDDENQWVIEAFMEELYLTYFEELYRNENEVIIEVKITKESNDPALFITKIIGLNKIGTHMNVLFKGTLIDYRKTEVEDILQSLIQENIRGEELLNRFKQKLKEK